MIISILNNQNHRYFSYYINKFIDFIQIYYDINVNIISFFIVFNNLDLEFIILFFL